MGVKVEEYLDIMFPAFRNNLQVLVENAATQNNNYKIINIASH